MWDNRIDALKEEIASSKVLSTTHKKDLHDNLSIFLITIKNTPDTLSDAEGEEIMQLFETVIHETTADDRTTAKATAARRALLKAIHDKEEQAEKLSELIYDIAQMLASTGV